MRGSLAAAGLLSLLGCSASLRRPLQTTEASTGLEQVTVSRENEFNPAISPDAQAVAYEAAAAPGANPHVEVLSLRAGPSGPARVAYSGGAIAGREPTWLPDDSGLLFASVWQGATRLVHVARLGHGSTESFANVGSVDLAGLWPAVSPDGTAVAVSLGSVWEFETGWPATHRVDDALGILGLGTDRSAGSGLVGTGVVLLGPGSEPSWSPDGARIAFVRVTGGHAHLFVARADGRDAQQITEGSADDEEPSWSPDGRLVAFCSAHASDGALQANLFAVGSDGSSLVQLTEGDRVACRPSWGRDGLLYFHANATDGFHIWRIRPTIKPT